MTVYTINPRGARDKPGIFPMTTRGCRIALDGLRHTAAFHLIMAGVEGAAGVARVYARRIIFLTGGCMAGMLCV